MTILGIDDTDSRTRGLCTTYVATKIANTLRQEGTVDRILLIRLNPAVEHKTRGNAAIALHTDLSANRVFELAETHIAATAELDDPNTHPGLVVSPGQPTDIPDDIIIFARDATRHKLTIQDAQRLITAHDYLATGWKTGRGRIGALAAIGAWPAFSDWTYEYLTYRDPSRIGTSREVNERSVFAAAGDAYPEAWDTVDRIENDPVCIPHTPGPVLYGIRGDDPTVIEGVADRIQSEPVADAQLFVTNQGTDIHLQEGSIESLEEGCAYRVTGTVETAPETHQGGHVFFQLRGHDSTVKCAAFEPTKRFRDRVRLLRPGDHITACGEVSDGTIKLEKFAVRDLERTERVTPRCPDCTRTMESAGKNQGYRCRPCNTHAPEKQKVHLDRELETGWFEVPPCARRHIAKPLIRGGFDAPIHPER